MLGLLLTTTGLRLRSAYFQHRVRSILDGFAQVRLDHTTGAELLALVPSLRPEPSRRNNPAHPAQVRLEVELDNWPTWPFTRSDKVNEFLYKGGSWLGV
ncbi:MAG: hypothetical protein ACRD2R_08725, partial [Terriglobales bacterium]